MELIKLKPHHYREWHGAASHKREIWPWWILGDCLLQGDSLFSLFDGPEPCLWEVTVTRVLLLACSAEVHGMQCLSGKAAGAEGESEELLSSVDSHQRKTVLNLGSCWTHFVLTEASVSQEVMSMASTRSFEATLFPGITWISPELDVLLVCASVSGVSLQCYYPYAAFPSPLVVCCHLLSPLKITKSWYLPEEKARTLYCPLHTCSRGFCTCICSLASESWNILGYLFEISNECQEAFCSWKWRRTAEADKSAFSCWSLEHTNQNSKHKRYMEYKTEFSG